MKNSKKLNNIRFRFEKVITEELSFIRSLPQLKFRSSTRQYPVSKIRRERLCEMSFLVLFVAWEEFLESTFEHYLIAGQKYKKIIKLKIQINDAITAHEVICGERRQYVEWSDPDLVRKRAKIFFKEGEPYDSVLGSALVHLKRMRIVRNCSVHHLDFVSEQFNKMIREIYGSGRRISPGDFLLNLRVC